MFFPDQKLDEDAQIAFAAPFGEPTESHPVEARIVEKTEIHTIDGTKDRTDFWHTDITFMSRPPWRQCSVRSWFRSLVGTPCGPTRGRRTRHWPNLFAGFATSFPPSTSSRTTPKRSQKGHGNVWEGKKLTRLVPAVHPVVRVHPETGRKNLFVNPNFTIGVTDMPQTQSTALLHLLYEHMTEPAFVERYQWSAGTLAFWDNRSTMHYGIFVFSTERRVMHRVTLRGDRPVGPVVAAPNAE